TRRCPGECSTGRGAARQGGEELTAGVRDPERDSPPGCGTELPPRPVHGGGSQRLPPRLAELLRAICPGEPGGPRGIPGNGGCLLPGWRDPSPVRALAEGRGSLPPVDPPPGGTDQGLPQRTDLPTRVGH